MQEGKNKVATKLVLVLKQILDVQKKAIRKTEVVIAEKIMA